MKKKSIKTIRLKEKTYRRLEHFKLELIRIRRDPRITFDEVINALLDERKERVRDEEGEARGLMSSHSGRETS